MKPCIVWDSILSLDKSSKGDISQIVEMTTALAQQGIDVTLVALNAGKAKIDGAKIVQVPQLWYIRQRIRTLGRVFPRLFGYDSRYNARHIAKFVVSVLDPVEHYDLYHVRTRNLAIELKYLQPDKPLVYTVIPQYIHTRLQKDRIIDQKAIDAADKLIALSQGWKQFIIKNFDLRGCEITVIPVCVRNEGNASKIDNSLDNLLKGYKVIGYFGRLWRNYGIDILLKAIPEVREKVNNLSVIIAGGSVYNYGAELKKLTRNLGIEECVHFIGEIPRDQVPYYIKKCDVLVSLRYDKNERSGFDVSIPIKCVEYIMHGKPVVATRDGGMEQLLGKDYPYFVEQDNKIQIAKSLIKLLTDEKEAKRVGRENRIIARNYSYKKITYKIINIYREILD